MKHLDSCATHKDWHADCTCLCVCGHSILDHHISYFAGAAEGEMLVEECEAYGWNEEGGMKYNNKTKEWEDHCQYFRLRQ